MCLVAIFQTDHLQLGTLNLTNKGVNKMDAYEVKKEIENSFNLGKIRQAIKTSKYFYNNESKRYDKYAK